MDPLLLCLDLGTTSCRALVFDTDGAAVATAQRPLTQSYPRPGWVEHDAEEILALARAVGREAVERSGAAPGRIAALGLTNQRETTVVWDRRSGRPIAPAIVWQDRRTADACETLRQEGLGAHVAATTGLRLDPYFSATKLAWLLDYTPGARDAARDGHLAFGTIDSWVLWHLTGGAHVTDVTNASRTMLFDIHRLAWDARLCERLGIPSAMLPEVRPSASDFGRTDVAWLGAAVPIRGVAGDQHAALFGQACLAPGQTKNTYGTGAFLLMNTGDAPATSAHGLVTTIAWDLGDGPQYALEGSVFVAGAAVQWLRDELGVIAEAEETAALAASVLDTGGVVFVPAFAGLGAPHWDPGARGLLVGLTRGTTRAHLARAALEAIAYQTREVVEAMQADAGLALPTLRADGGAAANDVLMQIQSDLLGAPVERPAQVEATAWGAAALAGVAAGLFAPADLAARWTADARFEPAPRADAGYADWLDAVALARRWAAK